MSLSKSSIFFFDRGLLDTVLSLRKVESIPPSPLIPFPFLLFPSLVTGEKGTSVSSLSEGEGDSTESEAGPSLEAIGGCSETTEPRGEEAVEL